MYGYRLGCAACVYKSCGDIRETRARRRIYRWMRIALAIDNRPTDGYTRALGLLRIFVPTTKRKIRKTKPLFVARTTRVHG